MKNYDFEKAKQLIVANIENLETAELGMHEDWFWTADTVFENGFFQKDLNEDTEIGGIQGSAWATPVIKLTYKDGEEEILNCYEGESEPDADTHPGRTMAGVGPLSSVAQANIGPIKEDK